MEKLLEERRQPAALPVAAERRGSLPSLGKARRRASAPELEPPSELQQALLEAEKFRKRWKESQEQVQTVRRTLLMDIQALKQQNRRLQRGEQVEDDVSFVDVSSLYRDQLETLVEARILKLAQSHDLQQGVGVAADDRMQLVRDLLEQHQGQLDICREIADRQKGWHERRYAVLEGLHEQRLVEEGAKRIVLHAQQQASDEERAKLLACQRDLEQRAQALEEKCEQHERDKLALQRRAKPRATPGLAGLDGEELEDAPEGGPLQVDACVGTDLTLLLGVETKDVGVWAPPPARRDAWSAAAPATSDCGTDAHACGATACAEQAVQAVCEQSSCLVGPDVVAVSDRGSSPMPQPQSAASASFRDWARHFSSELVELGVGGDASEPSSPVADLPPLHEGPSPLEEGLREGQAKQQERLARTRRSLQRNQFLDRGSGCQTTALDWFEGDEAATPLPEPAAASSPASGPGHGRRRSRSPCEPTPLLADAGAGGRHAPFGPDWKDRKRLSTASLATEVLELGLPEPAPRWRTGTAEPAPRPKPARRLGTAEGPRPKLERQRTLEGRPANLNGTNLRPLYADKRSSLGAAAEARRPAPLIAGVVAEFGAGAVGGLAAPEPRASASPRDGKSPRDERWDGKGVSPRDGKGVSPRDKSPREWGLQEPLSPTEPTSPCTPGGVFAGRRRSMPGRPSSRSG